MTTTPAAWTAGVRREVLPNGLTLLVQRDRSAPVAAVVTHVKAGFFDEPDRWAGISHVLEHMFFKGTPSRGPGQIARDTKAAGGYLNAGTGYDHTTYYVVLPADHLREAIAIQSDALMHAAIDADELARELQVIIQEARRKLDNPGAVTAETLHEVMYDHHRIRRWRIGYEKDLAGFTRADVHGYYASRYVPERTVVALVGDVDEEEMLAQGRAAYGGWAPAPGAVDPSPAEPDRREVRARTLRGDVSQAEVALGWRGVPALDPRAIPLDLAAGVLASGRGSWLYRALREPGLATAVSAYHYSPTELGTFTLGADCDPDRLPAVVGELAAAASRLATDGPADDDLERTRTLLLARWSRRLEDMDGRAAALAAAEALGDYRLLDRDFEQLRGTPAGEVRDAAAQVLDPGAVSAVTYLPRDRGAELTTADLVRAFEAAGAPRTRGWPVPVAAPAATVRRARGVTTAGACVAEVHHAALPGFDLLVRRKPGVPLVHLGVYVPRVEFDPAGQAGVSALAVRSAIRGAGDLDATGLAFAFERLGGTLGGSVALDWLGFSTSVLASGLAPAADLLARVLTAPSYDAPHVEAERRLLVEETTQAADDMFRYPFQLAFAELFGQQGYGVPALGLPADLAGITPDQVRAWHRRALLGRRGVVVAVGDLDPETAMGLLGGVFGDAVRAPASLAQPVAWQFPAAGAPRVVMREKAQTAFAMAFPGPARRDPSRHAAEVWSAVASGLRGRLFDALRGRRSLAATVLAAARHRAPRGARPAYIATAPEREEEARREMLRELSRFAAERVSATELAQATSYLAGQTAVGRQSGSSVLAEILEAWLAGGGLADLAGTAERYRAVTAEQVRVVAETTLGPAQRQAEGVVRGSGGGK